MARLLGLVALVFALPAVVTAQDAVPVPGTPVRYPAVLPAFPCGDAAHRHRRLEPICAFWRERYDYWKIRSLRVKC